MKIWRKLIPGFLAALLPCAALGEGTGMSLTTKGLMVTGLGLGGVFLVLVLFYWMIRLISRLGIRKDEKSQGD